MFIQSLSKQLVQVYASQRSKHVPLYVSQMNESVLSDNCPSQPSSSKKSKKHTCKRGYCSICKQRTPIQCYNCDSHVCSSHSVKVFRCDTCEQSTRTISEA